jgi:hypothetical protein
MGLVEAVLAAIGFVAILWAVARWQTRDEPSQSEPELSTPYREGLQAAMRMQAVAQDLEQQLYAEARRHAGHEGQQP